MQCLQEAVQSGQVNVLVLAAESHLANHWQKEVVEDLEGAMDADGVCVLFSPVLVKLPLKLWDCLEKFFEYELLGCNRCSAMLEAS